MGKNNNFEEMIKELEQIAKELESGDLSLDKSVEKFEEGIQISKSCSKILEDAEKRISILLKNSNGDIEEKEFNID